jgi:hypothetical protein
MRVQSDIEVKGECTVPLIVYGMWYDVVNHFARQQTVISFSALLECKAFVIPLEFAYDTLCLVFVHAMYDDLIEYEFRYTLLECLALFGQQFAVFAPFYALFYWSWCAQSSYGVVATSKLKLFTTTHTPEFLFKRNCLPQKQKM